MPLPLPQPQNPVEPKNTAEEKGGDVSVKFINSSYRVAEKKAYGWFTTGQDADIVNAAGGLENRGLRTSGFNLPQGALVFQGALFVADTGFNMVVAWKHIEDALKGDKADVILGDEDLSGTRPEIGWNKLFWPASLDFDGSFL